MFPGRPRSPCSFRTNLLRCTTHIFATCTLNDSIDCLLGFVAQFQLWTGFSKQLHRYRGFILRRGAKRYCKTNHKTLTAANMSKKNKLIINALLSSQAKIVKSSILMPILDIVTKQPPFYLIVSLFLLL